MKINVSKWVCNFCNRTEDEVAHIVVTPSEVAICDECVATCNELIAEASRPSDVKVKVTISNTGLPVESPSGAGLISNVSSAQVPSVGNPVPGTCVHVNVVGANRESRASRVSFAIASRVMALHRERCAQPAKEGA